MRESFFVTALVMRLKDASQLSPYYGVRYYVILRTTRTSMYAPCLHPTVVLVGRAWVNIR